jgi:hypothetical protein
VTVAGLTEIERQGEKDRGDAREDERPMRS